MQKGDRVKVIGGNNELGQPTMMASVGTITSFGTSYTVKGKPTKEDYFEIAKKRIEIIEEAMNCKNCDGRGDINIGANICWKCKGTGKSLTPTPITNEDNLK